LPEVKKRLLEENYMQDDFRITEEIIEGKLKKLKEGKAPGIDGIVPKILIENAAIVSKPLKLLYQKSMETGKVPVDWKKANVTAIYKKGCRETAGNYRPVSLTSHVCKVLESIIRDSIVNHLDRNKLIYKTQHGFVKGRSCLTNLLEFLEDVTEYVDQGSPVDVIYLDFQKAFDKVPHQRLLKKVQALGINGTVYTWIEDWLKNRTQRIQFGGDSSNWTSVLSGVPQGSVLGPILFLIYINDIDDGIESKILKFADDTKLYRRITSEEDVTKLQEDLATLCKWSREWLMLFLGSISSSDEPSSSYGSQSSSLVAI
jgi:hypothetical protein